MLSFHIGKVPAHYVTRNNLSKIPYRLYMPNLQMSHIIRVGGVHAPIYLRGGAKYGQ